MSNSLMDCRWQVEAERLTAFDVENRLTGQTLGLLAGGLPQVVLGDGRVLAFAQALPAGRGMTGEGARPTSGSAGHSLFQGRSGAPARHLEGCWECRKLVGQRSPG